MAMKYDKSMTMRILLPSLLSTLILVGCAGSSKQTNRLSATKQGPSIQSSLQFVPKQSINEETGKFLPYVAAVNPYTAQKGKIDKASVVKFIDAKKAVKNRRYKQAENLLMQITQSNKTLSGPWVLLGDIEKLRKKPTAAIKHYQKATSVNKHNFNAYLKLAKLQREVGEFVQAQNTYASALLMWKDFPEAHLNLAIHYDLYLNQPLKAQRHMEAYQFLTKGKNKTVGMWLNEIQQRTGAEISLKLDAQKGASQPLSANKNRPINTESVIQLVAQEAVL